MKNSFKKTIRHPSNKNERISQSKEKKLNNVEIQ